MPDIATRITVTDAVATAIEAWRLAQYNLDSEGDPVYVYADVEAIVKEAGMECIKRILSSTPSVDIQTQLDIVSTAETEIARLKDEEVT